MITSEEGSGIHTIRLEHGKANALDRPDQLKTMEASMSTRDEANRPGASSAEIRRLHRHVRVLYALLVMLIATLAGFASWVPRYPDTIRVKHIIVEDSAGSARIVMGAPSAIPGRTPEQSGVGMVVLSPAGEPQVAVGSPTPWPKVNGRLIERVAGMGSSGLTFFDPDGNERGGLGAFPDGRANMCVDYARGVKEAACMFVYPGDQFAGFTVNGHPSHGYERANLIVSADGLAQVKISALGGQERAILRTDGTAPAELLVYDPQTQRFVNVMPRP